MAEAAAEQADIQLLRDGAAGRLVCSGDWRLPALPELLPVFDRLDLKGLTRLEVSLERVARIDTAAAWQLYRRIGAWRDAGAEVEVTGLREEQKDLLAQVADLAALETAPGPKREIIREFVERIGVATVAIGLEARDLLNFLGMTIVTLGRALGNPRRLPFTAIVNHMQQTGLNALPIVGLLAFLIGVVLAYQGADQLATFGAEIFTVNLVGLGVLREMGILITAIIVAGRSGSAFTAQIGTMQVNEEIDALETIGLDPVQVLVLPRVIALVLVLPLLTFYADVLGVLGGAFMCIYALDITPEQFMKQFQAAVAIDHFWVGLSKAPIFAFIISLVGCFEGMKVGRSAASVGRQTTKAVVEAVFLVIVLDAFFSIFYSIIGV
ncbi:MAG: ABC transporter permease [Limibacillus sp.]|jgi:phospholipid/cholesterol/gamma-HCH transport system permease protein